MAVGEGGIEIDHGQTRVNQVHGAHFGTCSQGVRRVFRDVDIEQGAQKFYRGEGVFLGWPQERLEAAYRALLPPSEGPGDDHLQLG